MLTIVFCRYKKESGLVHCLLESLRTRPCLAQLIYNKFSKYLEKIACVLHKTNHFYTHVMYHQLILNSGSGLHARSPTMSCPALSHTSRSPLTSFYYGTSKHKLLNLVTTLSFPCHNLLLLPGTSRRPFRTCKGLGSPKLEHWFHHSLLQELAKNYAGQIIVLPKAKPLHL